MREEKEGEDDEGYSRDSKSNIRETIGRSGKFTRERSEGVTERRGFKMGIDLYVAFSEVVGLVGGLNTRGRGKGSLRKECRR